MSEISNIVEGGCTCSQIRYKISTNPLIVHCCHCRWCQRQTGTAFALNALIEADHVEIVSGHVEEIDTLSPSGLGQTIARCPSCKVAVWSSYHMGGLKKRIKFIRVGTLDNPDLLPPDIHIYTSTKQPWVLLPTGAQAVSEFYDVSSVWSEESLNRRAVLFEKAGLN